MSVPEILAKRRDRAIAIILGVKEREVDDYLPKPVQQKLRKVILDQMNEYYELCLDLLPSLEQEGVVLNEVYLEKMAALHDGLGEVQRLLKGIAS